MTIELTKEHKYRTKALAVPYAYWSKARQAYCVDDPDARAAGAVMTLFPEVINNCPEILDIRNAGFADARPYDFASELGIRLDLASDSLGGKTLYEWQDTDGGYLKAIMERDGGAHVGWDRGLGKTLISAAFIQKLEAKRTLIVTRNGTQEPVWLAELAPALRNYELVVYPDSTSPSKQRKVLEYMRTRREQSVPLVFIIHYQAVRTIAGDKTINHRDGTTQVKKAGGDGWKALGRWDLMVYDESHRLANYNPNSSKCTQEGKALAKLRKLVKYAVNLSGSGVMNKPDDLFGQLHLLYPSIYKAKWADWNDRYVDYLVVNNRKVAIGWKLDKLPELHKELGVFMVYRTKREVFDLPPLIHQDVKLPLLPEQRRIYNQVRDEFWASIENESAIIANSPMDQMNKLRQIATAYRGIPSAKIEYALAELEDNPDEQFVVFTYYKAPGRLLAEMLGADAVVHDGDTSRADRALALERHASGSARVLIGSIDTIGESMNFQYCHEALRLDRHWNPGKNDQTVDRLNRHGQQERVTFRDLWALDTVDMLRVWPNLLSKQSMRMALYGQD